ncbi:MAG: TetR family transcriptional regulator C-terminal domain-containing protein [Akkermansiaceae bacterium]
MKEISKAELTEAYLSHLLEHGKAPASVYHFCKELEIEERQFYQCASSFKALEGSVWKELFEKTHSVLEADGDYPEYPVRQKLAAFYYTFFEVALNHRSFIELRFAGFPGGLACPSLKGFREAFEGYVNGLVNEGLESGEVANRGKLSGTYARAFFAQWVFIVDFWLKDESDQFSRTDALIDKSVSLALDAVGSQVIDSAFDMLRFLAGRNTTV